MATTSLWKISSKLVGVIEYTTNKEKTKHDNIKYSDLHKAIEYTKANYKTEEQFYVSGINCHPETAYEEMQKTKEFYNKKEGILGFHGFQSFNEGEVTPELAHEIGIKLAQEVWGDRFEVIVSTHLNTNHIHNHFIINSVSFKDGKKFYSGRASNAFMRHMNDEICSEYGLSVLDEKICKSGINYNNYYKKFIQKNGYRKNAKEDVDFAIREAFSYSDFINLLSKMGYESYERYGRLSVNKYNKQPIRLERSYGDMYSIPFIKKRILETQSSKVPFIDTKIADRKYHYITFNKVNKHHFKISGFMAIYFHYYYLLKRYEKDRIYVKITSKMRAEIRKMNLYSQEAKFISKNNICNNDDLENYKAKKLEEIKDYSITREGLWYKRKKIINEDERYNICKKIEILNNQIEQVREEVHLCEDIKKRIPMMKQDLNELKEQEQKNTNEKKEEIIRKL